MQFWIDDVDHSTIPGCLKAIIDIPGGTGEVNVTIDYYYGPLYRLTEADYSTGEYFWYTYDAVGNRMTQETHEDSNTYVYDDANKLIDVDGVDYSWDVNGNLLFDSVSTYTYNHANYLMTVTQGDDVYEFEYGGLGDRLSQSVNGEWADYTLDINQALTQVLDDGSNAYLYGIGRIGEEQDVGGWQYHLGDALGSVRQLTDSSLDVTQAKSYQPFGEMLMSSSSTNSGYGFTGEWMDLTGLTYLRTRYYDPIKARFLTRDLWDSEPNQPMSYNEWLYVFANPVNLTDPSGRYPICGSGIDPNECLGEWAKSIGQRQPYHATPSDPNPSPSSCREFGSNDPWGFEFPPDILDCNSGDCREEKARMVYQMLVENSDYWWGSPPNDTLLAGFLLEREGNILNPPDQKYMAEAIHSLYKEQLSAHGDKGEGHAWWLSAYTVSFNPSGNTQFTMEDWSTWLIRPGERFIGIISPYFTQNAPYVELKYVVHQRPEGAVSYIARRWWDIKEVERGPTPPDDYRSGRGNCLWARRTQDLFKQPFFFGTMFQQNYALYGGSKPVCK